MRNARFVVCFIVIACCAFGRQSQPASGFDPGLKVGQAIPKFSLNDQNGKPINFDALKGPKGVALLFFRSADW